LKKSIYISIATVSLILGLMISFQFRTNSSITGGIPTERYQELTLEKKQVETDITHLEEEVVDLTAKIEEARKGRTEAADVLESELNKIKLYAGLTPVEGPGVEIVMDNTPASPGAGSIKSGRRPPQSD
jgi:uncharacterized protein YlxW (UPF0749 family)